MWTTPGGVTAAVLTAAAAAFYSYIGINAIRRPKNLLRSFGLIAESADARNEIRGVYGGMTLALGALLASTLVVGTHAVGILTAVAVLTVGIALGRIVSATIDQSFGAAPRFWCLAEVLVTAALVAAAWLSSSPP